MKVRKQTGDANTKHSFRNPEQYRISKLKWVNQFSILKISVLDLIGIYCLGFIILAAVSYLDLMIGAE
jgi:hypothetical protein